MIRPRPIGHRSDGLRICLGEDMINKLAKAHYICLNIEASQAVMSELEHAFKFNDAVLRHMTVLRKKADTAPSIMMKTVEREEARKNQQAEFAG